MASFLTTPLDVLKTRIQLYPDKMRNKGYLRLLFGIAAREGRKGLFSGYKARTTASVIIIPVVINSYEMVHYSLRCLYI